MSDNIITQISLNAGDTLEVKARHKAKPSFYMIGDGKMNRHKMQAIDLLAEVAIMNSDEKLCLLMIKDSISQDYDLSFIYQTRVDTSKLTNSQKSKFSRGYTSLHKKDLVRRVKRGIYMINPNALVPSNYIKEIHIWDLLENKGEKK